MLCWTVRLPVKSVTITKRRTNDERIPVSLSRRRNWPPISRTYAADHAEMDGLVERARRERPYQGPGAAARTYRQAGEGQAEDRDGRALSRDQGYRGWIHVDPGPRSCAGRRALEGVSDPRV